MFEIFRRTSPEDRFAHQVAERLRRTGWPHEIVYLKEDFALQTAPDGDFLYLENVYRDWLTFPKRAQASQLDRIVAPVLEAQLVGSYAEAEARLRPVIRSLTDLQCVALEAEPPTPGIWQPWAILVEPLAIILAVDLPNSIALVSNEILAKWGKTFDDLLPKAMDNLVAASPVRFEQADGGFYISCYGDIQDSSRLLMPELVLALQLRGDPIAVAVRRDQLVVAGSEDIPALNAMAAYVIEEFDRATRPMSYLPLVLRDGRWERLDLPSGAGPAALRELGVRQDVWDYGLQTPRLERFLAHSSRDIYVPPLEVLIHEGEAFTWTTWTQDVPAALPRANGVGLTASDGRVMFRLWADIEAVAGSFPEDATLHPPRYSAADWLSESQWKRLEETFSTPEWWPTEAT